MKNDIKPVEIYVFIPVYNELGSLRTISENIDKILKIFPDAKILISDNCSTDGSWEEFRNLANGKPGSIIVHQNPTNIGFSQNMMNVRLLPESATILILGANDIVFTAGLRRLKRVLKSTPDADIIMCNWAYFRLKKNGRRRIIWKGDVSRPFRAETLDEFFKHHSFPPNGIMQWVAKREVLVKMAPYTHLNSPHLGAFFDAFPCSFVAMGNPPIALAAHVEKGGWRWSSESILKSHMEQAEELILHLNRCLSRQTISPRAYNHAYYVFWKTPVLLSFNLFLGRWGHWNERVLGRIKSTRYLCLKMFQIPPPQKEEILSGCWRFFIWRPTVKALRRLLPRRAYKQLRNKYRRTKLVRKRMLAAS